MTTTPLFYGIVFNPNAAAFTISGNAVKVKRVANFSNVLQTVNLSLNTGDADCLFLAEPGNILVSKPIVGSHGLEKYGSADLTLTAANTYTGTTDIEAGRLKLSDGGTIDASSGILSLPGQLWKSMAASTTWRRFPAKAIPCSPIPLKLRWIASCKTP